MRRAIWLAGLLSLCLLLSACGDTAEGTDSQAEFSENAAETSEDTEENASSVSESTGSMPSESPKDSAENTSERSADSEASTSETEDFATSSITTDGGTEIPFAELEHFTSDADAPVVYYVGDISSEALVEVYDALEWTPEGKTAVKLSTGEPPASNYLQPELIADLVHEVDGTIVECMTAYGGKRASVASAKQVAEDHGYTAIADFDLMDEEGDVSIPVEGGTRLDEALIGSHVENYGSVLVLSHFKGHAMAGFGGAIKNVAIGMSSRSGKALVHSGGTSTTNVWGGEQDAFLESLGEATKGVSAYFDNGENIVYVSVMNRLSVDCDCDGNPAEPDMHDIGILASRDPVALDQACVDLVYAAPDGDSLINRMESRNGIHTLEHAEEIGLGSRAYRLVDLSAAQE